MPDKGFWESFFEPKILLTKLGLTPTCNDVAEFGCGYGTFTIPAAQIIRGTVYAFDIEPEMVEASTIKAYTHGLQNIQIEQRDFVQDGTGISNEQVDYVMLFNILHAEEHKELLREAWRILIVGGILGIIHWNYDSSTPRGPSMDIRPKPEQCRDWAEAVGFQSQTETPIDLPPYHYGWILIKSSMRTCES